MNKLKITEAKHEHWPKIQQLCDEVIGKNYYTSQELVDFERRSQLGNQSCSFVLLGLTGEVLGARVTFAPGKWLDSLVNKCHPSLWGVEPEKVAYFKSLIVNKAARGQGWGPKLSEKSLHVLKKNGAKAVICHSWLESPDNSSQRYLLKYGFKPIKNIENFWIEKDYHCTRCGPKPCICTAVEMIYTLD